MAQHREGGRQREFIVRAATRRYKSDRFKASWLLLVHVSLILLTSSAAIAAAQDSVRGLVVDSATQLGLPGAVVSARDSGGHMVGRTITNGQGAFLIRPTSSPARLDIVRIGYRPQRTTPKRDESSRIAMVPVAQLLTAMKVSDRALCPGSSGAASTFELWEQARAGLLASIVAREANPASVRSVLYERELAELEDVVRRQNERIHVGQSTRPFLAPRPEQLASAGYMKEEGTGRRYFAPDADVLFDDSFAASHCFRAQPADAAHAGQIGLAFAPQKERAAPVDVSGVIWIQADHPEVRSIDFRYTGLESAMADAGGHIELVSPPNGAAFIDRWSIRVPILTPVITSAGSVSEGRVVRSRSADYRATGVYVAGGVISSTRWKDGSSWEAPPTGISGIVVDRRSGEPAGNVLVTFAGTTDTLVTDSLGRFTNREMLAGTYQMIASDTSLLALGRDRSDRRVVRITRGEVLGERIELPSIQESIAQICENPQSTSDPAMLVGRVLFSSPAFARGARVGVSWRFTDSRLASAHRLELTRDAEVDSRGRFVACALPLDQRLDLHLTFDGGHADTSIVIHRTYVGRIAWRTSPGAERAVAKPSRELGTSPGIAGTVVRAENGAPVPDADVSLPMLNRHVRTDSAGAFRFENIPQTTQDIEIQKLGFAPLRDTVTLGDGSTVRHFALVSHPPELDTVQTIASAPASLSPSLREFETRRLSHEGGHFISDSVLRANDNKTLLDIVTSRIPGVSRAGRSLVSSRKPCRGLALRGCTTKRDCFVSVYIDRVLQYRAQMTDNGTPPPDLSVFDVHNFAGVEFYADAASAPAGMHVDDDGCGSLWLWTREK